MTRILFFNYEYPPLGGGAANATEQILKVFGAQSDIEIDLVTSAIGDTYEKLQPFPHITVHRLPIGKNADTLNYQTQKELLVYSWRAFRFAQKLIKENHYHLTHSFFGIPCGVLSLGLKWLYKIPYIVSLRGADVPGYSERFVWIYRFLTPLIRLVWKEASFVVTNSQGLTELASTSAKKQRFEEIYNGIDTDFYTPGTRTEEDRKEKFVILCAGRLSFRKGFQWALDAVATLTEKYTHVELVLAGGDGGVMYKLQGQAQAYSILDQVTFTGRYTKESAAQLYRDADLFLMPSLNEGMSNNVLEALSAGLPILMTDTGGARELVTDGENGYLIKMRSDEDIIEKISHLIEDQKLLSAMAEKSREKAFELTWESTANQYSELYKKVRDDEK